MSVRSMVWMAWLLVIASVHAGAASAQTRIFRDDFNGAAGSTPSQWWVEDHYQGRGKFGQAGWVNGSGAMDVSVGRYNASAPGVLAQTSMRTQRLFQPSPGRVLDFRIRARIWGQDQRGIVTAFFLYSQGQRNGAFRSDEADIEWLTNAAANRTDDSMLISTWHNWNRDDPHYDIDQHPQFGTQISRLEPLGFDIGGWQTYTIRWGQGVLEFFVDQPNGQWRYIGGYYGGQVPTQPMHLFVNAWAPDSSWSQAFDASLQPTSNPAQQAWHGMSVDWIEVLDRPSPN